MKKNLHISVVTYKTSINLLEKSLPLLLNEKRIFKVTIIDNSPNDEISEYIHSLGFQYIHNPKNPGYGAGHNIALKQSLKSGIDFHLILNSDVYISPNSISKLLDFIESNPNCGLVMPKVLYPDGSIQYLCKLVPSPIDLTVRLLFPGNMFLKRKHHFELRQSNYDKTMFVPYLSGCFMLLRMSAISAVGLFDERFFMYPEDIDLSRRIAAQFDTIFYPKIHVVHEHQADSKKSIKMLFVHVINIIRYFNKWGWVFDKNRSRLNRKTLDSI